MNYYNGCFKHDRIKPDDDLLEKLLTLNLELAEKEKRGEAIGYRLYELSEEERAIVEGRDK